MTTAALDESELEELVERSLDRLETYIVTRRYRGYDPYDALLSPLFRLPVLRSSKWLRLAAQQTLKRSPYNLRPMLRVPESYNPVTLAFVLEGSAYRARVDPERADEHRARADQCVGELRHLRSPGYHGDCWGYPFDWEGRYGRLPAFTPTIVATGIVTNALFVAHRLLDWRAHSKCVEAPRDSCSKIYRAHLRRTECSAGATSPPTRTASSTRP